MVTYLFQRVVHNDLGWTGPSRGRRSTNVDGGFLNETGFAGEDWNFAVGDTIAGHVFGYSRYQPVNATGTYNIAFAVYETGHRWNIAGFYEGASFQTEGPKYPAEIVDRRAASLHGIRSDLSEPYRNYTLRRFKQHIRTYASANRIKVPLSGVARLPAPLEVEFSGIERMGFHFGTATKITEDQYRSIRSYCSNVFKSASSSNSSFPEGKLLEKRHRTRERSTRLVQETKRLFRQRHGRLFCEVCEFDFANYYGDIGIDFIEAHHTIPVHTLSDGDRTRIEDMALVCSNCHRMLHRKRPWLRKHQIKNLLLPDGD